ncbi:transmembrane protease serine 9-like [Battus philenor]|uniref:transmembrane protease serine 9-like n=1 Tax=Battus philenor TaxID=42288 RepID=UPI0035D10337
MGYKVGFLLATLLVGSLAFPKPVEEDDMSHLYGHSDPTGRIVGGSSAGTVRHMVALSSGLIVRNFLCGGSLVSRNMILTAAHCINAVFSGGSLSNSLRATVGTNRWNSGGTHYNIQRNITHPNYVQATIKNDIGLLRTSSNVVLNNNVATVALNYNFIGGNVDVVVTGWGRVRHNGALSAELLRLNKQTVEGSRCVTEVARRASQLNIRAPAVEPHIELCTFHSAGRGTCNGDSGGPLLTTSNNQQVGIVSWGLPCAQGAPDMFVRVSAYRSWLSQHLTKLHLPTAFPKPEFDFEDLFYHTDPNARIVGGSPAADGSVPYMVAMSSGAIIRNFMCGGSLISTRHVLTAAHCIAAVFSFGSLSNSLRVTVGTNRWNSGGQLYSLSRNITHPHYVSSIIKNDIGILVTSNNVALSNRVQLVPLSFDNIGGGVLSRAAGWGRIRQNGALSNTLLELHVWTLTGEQCIRDMERRTTELGVRMPPIEPHIELCTFHSAGHGMCNGDSGSALVNIADGKQIGIVSWGLPCARAAPDAFVRVSAYRTWINNSIRSA